MNAEKSNATPDRTATEAIHEITDASKEMFQAGERIATNLDSLEKRIEHATDWRARLAENPLLLIAGALVSGVLLWRLFRR